MQSDRPKKPEKLSVFAEAMAAARKATIENNKLKITFKADEHLSIAITSIFNNAVLMPDLLRIIDMEGGFGRVPANKLFGEDGTGLVQIEVPVNARGGKMSASRNPTTGITTMEFPIRPSRGEQQTRQKFVNTIRQMHANFVSAFEEKLPKLTFEDAEDSRASGTYLVIGTKDEMVMRMLGELFAFIAGAHGFTNHVHTLPEGSTPHINYSAILVKPEARDGMLKAEKSLGHIRD